MIWHLVRAVAMGMLVALSAIASHRLPQPAWQTQPCRTEDSVNCYWNAHDRGTGHGRSFYVRTVGRVTCVTYLDGKGNYCTRSH